MGIFSRTHTARRRLATPDALDNFWYAPTAWQGAVSQSGVRVTPELAMMLSTVWYCTTFIARNVGSLPCEMKEHTGPKATLPAPQHPLAPVIGLQPNLTQDRFQWIEQGVGHLMHRGNWYNRVVPGRRGYVDQLVPFHPDLVRVGRLPTGRLQYKVRSLTGQPPEILTQDEMFHVRGYSTDGLTGLSMIAYGATSLGIALAQNTYTARFFKQGVSAAIAVEHPGVLGEEGSKNLRESVGAYLLGLENAGGILTLEEGAKLNTIGVSPEDAQLLGMKGFSREEILEWFGLLPPSQVGSAGKPPTYASSVQFAEDLVRYSFRPLCERIELAMRTQLILDPVTYSAAFDLTNLQRGNIQERTAAYHLGILDGWMNRNEVRALEGLNPADGLDDFWEPQNVRDANDPNPPPTGAPQPPVAPPADARRDVRATILAIEAAGRVVRKEIAAVTKGAKDHAHDPAAWSSFLRTFYDDHAGFVAATLHLPLSLTRDYAARQGLRLEQLGIKATEDFEATAAPELAAWALDGRAIKERVT
jgi:HK97 family phage portal protein